MPDGGGGRGGDGSLCGGALGGGGGREGVRGDEGVVSVFGTGRAGRARFGSLDGIAGKGF